ncbi:MAG TPA: hypothetical protein VJS30_13135 [Paraburkholderia sp.]|nr:hypothetical protein [Paraburkholderia sp.]
MSAAKPEASAFGTTSATYVGLVLLLLPRFGVEKNQALDPSPTLGSVHLMPARAQQLKD